MTDLSPRWHDLLDQLGLQERAQQILQGLITQYNSSKRYYHNLDHIAHCLQEFDKIQQELARPHAVELALWFHDVVYTITSKSGSEQASARHARTELEGLPESLLKMVQHHIYTTVSDETEAEYLISHLQLPASEKLVATADARYVKDIDLAILGQPAARYIAYADAIRKEYRSISTTLYNPTRAKFLATLLMRDTFYQTDFFRDAYENQARKNMTAEIQRLA